MTHAKDGFEAGFREGKTEATMAGLARSIDNLMDEQKRVHTELVTFKENLPCAQRAVFSKFIFIMLMGAWTTLGILFYAFLSHLTK